MGSYIKFVFKYLFQSDDYLAELERLNGSAAGLNPSTASASSSSSSLLDLNLNDHLTHDSNVPASSLAGYTNRSSSSSSDNNNRRLVSNQMSECQLLSHQLMAEHNRSNPLKSFAEFEAFFKQHSQQQQPGAATALLPVSESSINDTLASSLKNATNSSSSGSSYNQLDLYECFNQLQLQDYYAGYDTLVGLRIASTLTILFVVFLLFVIYKTGYQEGRSQLSVVSSAAAAKKAARLLDSRPSLSQLVGYSGGQKNGPSSSSSKSRQQKFATTTTTSSGHPSPNPNPNPNLTAKQSQRQPNQRRPKPSQERQHQNGNASAGIKVNSSGQSRSSITCDAAGSGSAAPAPAAAGSSMLLGHSCCCHDFTLATSNSSSSKTTSNPRSPLLIPSPAAHNRDSERRRTTTSSGEQHEDECADDDGYGNTSNSPLSGDCSAEKRAKKQRQTDRGGTCLAVSRKEPAAASLHPSALRPDAGGTETDEQQTAVLRPAR